MWKRISKLVVVLALCMSFAVLPAAASYSKTLEIFGNANMDDVIDKDDIEYVEGIIEGTNEITELSDANYDGEIDEDDITQIRQIIQGKETELTLLDMDGRTVTIPQPVERVVGIGYGFIENTMYALGVEDKIVGSGGAAYSESTTHYLIPEINDLPNAGPAHMGLNYETVAATNPDLVIVRKSVYFAEQTDKAVEMIEKLDIPVIVLVDPNHFHTSDITTIYQEIELLGEIFDRKKSAQQLIDDMDARVSLIIERTNNIGEEEKPNVLFCGLGSGRTRDKGGILVVWAKECASTFADLINIKSAYDGTGRAVLSDEHVLDLDPDVIILETSSGGTNTSQLYEETYYKNIQELKAIKDKRVYSIGKLTSCGDIQLELPVILMIEAKGTYPEQFSDISVSEWTSEYYGDIYQINDNEAQELREAQKLAWIDDYGF